MRLPPISDPAPAQGCEPTPCSGTPGADEAGHRPRAWRHDGIAAVITSLLLVAAVLIYVPLWPKQRFAYDEADYMYAASKGFRANYLDRAAIPIAIFWQKGLAAVNASNWSALSKYIRNTDDITFYRHFHGPLYVYSLALTNRLFGTGEKSLRVLGLATLIVCAVILFLGCFIALPQHSGVAAVMSVVFLLASPNNLQAAMWLGPHTLYTATALIALFFMAMLVQTNRNSFLYASAVSIAVSFAAVEYALLLLITLLLVVALRRKMLFARRRTRDILLIVAKCAGLFLATLLAIWPASILKLTIVKDYLFFLYFSTVRSASAYGSQPLLQVWWLRVRSSPLEFACLGAFAAVFLWKVVWKKQQAFLLPFAVYAALMFATTLRNRSLAPVYVCSFLPPLYVIAAVLLAGAVASRRTAMIGLIAIVLTAITVNGYFYTYRQLSQLRPDPFVNGVVEVLDRGGAHNRNILVPHDYLPTAHYYFPSNTYSPYQESATIDDLLQEIAASHLDGVVYVGRSLADLEGRLAQKGAAATVAESSLSSTVAYIPLR